MPGTNYTPDSVMDELQQRDYQQRCCDEALQRESEDHAYSKLSPTLSHVRHGGVGRRYVQGVHGHMLATAFPEERIAVCGRPSAAFTMESASTL